MCASVICTPWASKSRKQSLTSTPGSFSSFRISTVLKVVHGAYFDGRFSPDESAVKPKMRPGPLKICTCIFFIHEIVAEHDLRTNRICPVRSMAFASAEPGAGRQPRYFRHKTCSGSGFCRAMLGRLRLAGVFVHWGKQILEAFQRLIGPRPMPTGTASSVQVARQHTCQAATEAGISAACGSTQNTEPALSNQHCSTSANAP